MDGFNVYVAAEKELKKHFHVNVKEAKCAEEDRKASSNKRKRTCVEHSPGRTNGREGVKETVYHMVGCLLDSLLRSLA